MAKKRGKIKHRSSKSGSYGKTIFIVIAILIVLIISSLFLFKGKGKSYSQEQIDALAKCLTEKGVVMYGAFWCPHCARTKARFGSAFKYVTYVECDPKGDNNQAEFCISKGIERYDTWDFANNERYDKGEPSFELLAEKSGCSFGDN